MHECKTLSGRLTEARRDLTRAARLRDHDPTRERWELWLTTADGQGREARRGITIDART